MNVKLASTVLAGIAVATAVGAVAASSTKKRKARRTAKKTAKQLEAVGGVIQSIASMTR